MGVSSIPQYPPERKGLIDILVIRHSILPRLPPMLENHTHQRPRFRERESDGVGEFAEAKLFAGFFVARDGVFGACGGGLGGRHCVGGSMEEVGARGSRGVGRVDGWV